jgi:hypothetical protein
LEKRRIIGATRIGRCVEAVDYCAIACRLSAGYYRATGAAHEDSCASPKSSDQQNCGFSTTFAGDFAGHVEHDCDPTRHAPVPTAQGTHVGRSPRPETLSRVRLDQLLACVHRGPELRQEPYPTCPAGTRIKIFACAIHGECQLDDRIVGVNFCEECDERKPSAV